MMSVVLATLIAIAFSAGCYKGFIALYHLPDSSILIPPVRNKFIDQLAITCGLGLLIFGVSVYATRDVIIGFFTFLLVTAVFILNSKHVSYSSFIEQSPVTLFAITTALAAFFTLAVSLYGVYVWHMLTLFCSLLMFGMGYFLYKARTLEGAELDSLRPVTHVTPELEGLEPRPALATPRPQIGSDTQPRPAPERPPGDPRSYNDYVRLGDYKDD